MRKILIICLLAFFISFVGYVSGCDPSVPTVLDCHGGVPIPCADSSISDMYPAATYPNCMYLDRVTPETDGCSTTDFNAVDIDGDGKWNIMGFGGDYSSDAKVNCPEGIIFGDSCPNNPDSGVDTDGDGVDDVCDSCKYVPNGLALGTCIYNAGGTHVQIPLGHTTPITCHTTADCPSLAYDSQLCYTMNNLGGEVCGCGYPLADGSICTLPSGAQGTCNNRVCGGTEDNAPLPSGLRPCDSLLTTLPSCKCADGIDNNGNGQIDCADTGTGPSDPNSCANSQLCQCLKFLDPLNTEIPAGDVVSADCCKMLGKYQAIQDGLTAWGDSSRMFDGECNGQTANCHRLPASSNPLVCVKTTNENAISIPYRDVFEKSGHNINCDTGERCCVGFTSFPLCNLGSGGGGGGTGPPPPPNPPGPTPCSPAGSTISAACQTSSPDGITCYDGTVTSICQADGNWSGWSTCQVSAGAVGYPCSGTTTPVGPPVTPGSTPISWHTYTLAYIDSPLWGANYNLNVLFNGTDSYTVNVTNWSDLNITVVCLAGNCPDHTEGYYHGMQWAVHDSPNWTGFPNLNFTWKIDGVQTITARGWLGSNFTQSFIIPRQHNATLNASVNFLNSIPGFNKVIFSTSLGRPRCVANSTSANWIMNNGVGDYILTPFNCSNLNGYDDVTGVPRTSCCPSVTGILCNVGSGVCQTNSTPNPIVRCSDYNLLNFGSLGSAQSACNADVASVGIFSVEEIPGHGAGFCGSTNYVSETCTRYISGCGCIWNTSTTSCDTTFNATQQGTTGCPSGVDTCAYNATSIVDDCAASGSLSYHATAYGSLKDEGSPLCQDKEVPGLCAKSLMQLPFFTWVNFVIVVAILIVVYFLLSKKKPGKNKIAKKRRK